MHSRRTFRGRTLSLALGTSLVLAACADARPTASDAAGPSSGPRRIINTAIGQMAEQTIAMGIAFAVAVQPNGTVAAWGHNRYPANQEPGEKPFPADLSDVVAVSAYGDHALALRADGTVVGWGENQDGEASPPPLSGVIGIGTGENHSFAIRNDGSIAAWGKNDYGQINVPPGLSHVAALEGGYQHSLALKQDGTVVGWGRNSEGQASPPHGLTDVTAVAAGDYHSAALRTDGTVVTWGESTNHVPAGLSNVVAIDAGWDHTLALKSDGTVVAWGIDAYGETRVPQGLAGVVAIAASGNQSMALRRDGSVIIWGFGPYDVRNVPVGLTVRVPSTAPWAHPIRASTALTSGHRYTFAIPAGDMDGDSLTYAWDMDADGTPERTSGQAGIYYAYPASGTYTARVTITDAKGIAVQRSAIFAVAQNVAPVAVIDSIPTINEGAVVTLTARVTDGNSPADTTALMSLAYRWEFSASDTSTDHNPGRRYTDNGTYPVKVRVTDRGGASSSEAEAYVQVNNLPPRATFMVPAGTTLPPGSSFTLFGRSITDPGADDRETLQISFDCGNGFGYFGWTSDLNSAVRCVVRLGTTAITVRMRVRDKDGAIAEYRRNYTIK